MISATLYMFVYVDVIKHHVSILSQFVSYSTMFVFLHCFKFASCMQKC